VDRTGRATTTKPLPHNGATPQFRGVLHVAEVAELLGTTEKTIRHKVDKHRLPFHRLQGRVIFFRDELEQFLRSLPGCSVQEALSENKERQRKKRRGTQGE